jgi:hypothetical protein
MHWQMTYGNDFMLGNVWVDEDSRISDVDLRLPRCNHGVEKNYGSTSGP